MIIFLSPQAVGSDSPNLARLLDHVEAVRATGAQAAVYQLDPRTAGPASLTNLRLTAPKDLIVIPSDYGDLIRTLHPGLPRVVLAMDPHRCWEFVSDIVHHPFVDNPDLIAVLTGGESNAAILRHAFPAVDVRTTLSSIGQPKLYSCGAFPRRKQICFDAARNPEFLLQVLGVLAARGELKNWDLIRMDGQPDAEVAQILQQSAIYLSLGEPAGAGGTSLKALAAGCIVAGLLDDVVEYEGKVISCVEDDLIGLCQKIAKSIRNFDLPQEKQRLRSTSKWALSSFTRQQNSTEVARLYLEFQTSAAAAPSAQFAPMLVQSTAAQLLAAGR